MKQAKLFFLLIAIIIVASCKPSAQQTAADAEQPTGSTEAVTSADTLRLVIADKSLSQSDSVIRMTLNLPLDSIVVEMMNNTDSTFFQFRSRYLDLHCATARERYERLLQRCPGIVEHLDLQDIASFLNVTPKTISMIRKDITFGKD